MTGAPVYIVHLSCREALEEAIRARLRGVQVWVETLIQYLLLDKSHAELPEFEGAKFVMSPPLRDKENQPVLWNGLRQGLINTVGTDHAPFDFAGQKSMGARQISPKSRTGSRHWRIGSIFSTPTGSKTGRLDLHTFVKIASTNAAKIFNLFPRKGTIQPGSDADLVIYDPNYRGKLSAATHLMNIDYNAFEGWPIEGRPSVVTVRGEVAVRDGKFVGHRRTRAFATAALYCKKRAATGRGQWPCLSSRSAAKLSSRTARRGNSSMKPIPSVSRSSYPKWFDKRFRL